MLLISLILIIPYVFGQQEEFLANETLAEIKFINDLPYTHKSEVMGTRAEFIFNISNITYATDVLNIDSYYYSITYIDSKMHEQRANISDLTDDEVENTHRGVLQMSNLEEHGNYLVCIIFLSNGTQIIASSRFCDVISVHGDCNLHVDDGTFTDGQVYVLLGFVFVILVFTIVFTCIRDFVYRPRTIEALLKTLPQHHAQKLETLAPSADDRRRRRTEAALNTRLRDDSVFSVTFSPNADEDYHNYHGIDNASLDILDEDEETD